MKKHIIFDCDGTLVDTASSKYALYPEIKELIVELASENFLYVWTARDRRSTMKILDDLGVLKFFESLCTIDDAFPKPHISGLKDLVGDAAKNSICVIGDTSNDILGAKNFGVMGIGATWNKGARPEYLKEAGADFIVSHPSECSKLIQLNLKGEDHV